MSDMVGMAFITGVSVGFMGCLFFCAAMLGSVDKKNIKAGYFVREGVAYRITPVQEHEA